MNWTPISKHPDHDCEVFILAEVLEDYYDFHKGQFILERDTYDHEADYFGESDEDRIRIICWQEMEYPDVPEEYEGKTEIFFKVMRPCIYIK